MTLRLLFQTQQTQHALSKLFYRLALSFGFVLLLTLLVSQSLFAATITVNTNGDVVANDGVCSLREAITAANSNSASGATSGECLAGTGADTINFAIGSSGAQTITLSSALPTLSGNITIDGSSQPGFVDIPLIRIDASSAGTTPLNVSSSNSTLKDLALVGNNMTALTLSSAMTVTLENLDLSRSAACAFSGSGTGISANGSSHLTIHNVSVKNRGSGMIFQNGSNIELMNNDFSGSGCANSAFALQLNNISPDSVTGRGVLAASNVYSGANQGIYLSNLSNLTVSNVQPVTSTHYLALEDSSDMGQVVGTALWLNNVLTTTVENVNLSKSTACSFSASGTGIYSSGSSHLTIHNVSVQNRGAGMYFGSGSDIELMNNDFSGSGCANAAFALQLVNISPDSATGRGLLVASNVYSGANQGIYLSNLSNLTVSNVQPVTSTHYLALEESSGMGQVAGTSLWLSSVLTATVENVNLSNSSACSFYGSGTGIYADNSSHLTIHNVSVKNRGSGMSFRSGSDIELMNNDFSGSGCANSAFALLLSNISKDSVTGRGVLAAGNVYTGANQGILLESLSNLTVSNVQPVTSTHYLALEDSSGIGSVASTSLWLSFMQTATVDSINLSSPNVSRSGNGLYVTSSNNLTVQSIRVKRRANGVVLLNTTNSTLSCNSLIDNDVALNINQLATIANNRFQDNSNAIAMGGTGPLIAENNYWGAANGPTALGGSGNSYSGNVDAQPFLTSKPPCAAQILYPVITSTSGAGSGSISLNPAGGIYDYATVVTATGVADSSSIFSSWSGDCSGNSACVLTVKATKSITAAFALAPPTGLQVTNSSPTVLSNQTLFTATLTAGGGITYSWNFGDGSPLENGSSITTSHSYAVAGRYVVTVTAANAQGSINKTTQVTITLATLTPNTFADELNNDGDCSLREAVTAANTDRAVDLCPAGNGADTISLAAGVYTITIPGAGENANVTGDFDITSTVTISGVGATNTVLNANLMDRAFEVGTGGNLTLNDLTIRNGVANGGDGGGVMLSYGASAVLNVNRSIFRDNRAWTIYNRTGTVTIRDSSIISNALAGPADAGALRNYDGGGSMTISNTTIAGNSGFGLDVRFGSITNIANSTFSSNGSNGAIIMRGGNTMNLNHVTIADNQGSTYDGIQLAVGDVLNIANSIIANNSGAGVDCENSGATIHDNGYNLIEDGTCLTAVTSISGTARLATLGNYGGPTLTHALYSDSPALDVIPASTSGCGTSNLDDQRGVARPQNDACDMGAFEGSIPAPDIAITNLMISTDSPQEVNNTVHFTASTASGNHISYTWNFGDGSIVVAPLTTTHSYGAIGSYSAIVTATNGTNTLSAATVVTVTPAGEKVIALLPGMPATLLYNTLDGASVQVEVPGSAITQSLYLVYNSEITPTTPPGNLIFGNRSFQLEAWLGNQILSGISFNSPLTLTLDYLAGDVNGLNENLLELYYFDTMSNQWSNAGMTVIERDTVNHRIVVSVSHLTEFALFQPKLPPIVTDDADLTLINTPLHVYAPGVLANDSDPEGAPLSAQLITPPANGTVDLASSGTFMYTPTTGFTGMDSFVYSASDGEFAVTGTVTINVFQTGSSAGPIVLPSDGWNLFGYPLSSNHSVSEVLASISGVYTTVFGYDASDVNDPWRMYDPSIPEPFAPMLNRLTEFEYGHGYWINLSQPATITLPSSSMALSAANIEERTLTPQPPATYYGEVTASGSFLPRAGMVVEARIGETLCGQSTTLEVAGGSVIYAIHVQSASNGPTQNCGIGGRFVTLFVEGRALVTLPWSNGSVQEVQTTTPEEPTVTSNSLYLPLVTNH